MHPQQLTTRHERFSPDSESVDRLPVAGYCHVAAAAEDLRCPGSISVRDPSTTTSAERPDPGTMTDVPALHHQSLRDNTAGSVISRTHRMCSTRPPQQLQVLLFLGVGRTRIEPGLRPSNPLFKNDSKHIAIRFDQEWRMWKRLISLRRPVLRSRRIWRRGRSRRRCVASVQASLVPEESQSSSRSQGRRSDSQTIRLLQISGKFRVLPTSRTLCLYFRSIIVWLRWYTKRSKIKSLGWD